MINGVKMSHLLCWQLLMAFLKTTSISSLSILLSLFRSAYSMNCRTSTRFASRSFPRKRRVSLKRLRTQKFSSRLSELMSYLRKTSSTACRKRYQGMFISQLLQLEGRIKMESRLTTRKEEESGHCRETMEGPGADREVQGMIVFGSTCFDQKCVETLLQTCWSLQTPRGARLMPHFPLDSLRDPDKNPFLSIFEFALQIWTRLEKAGWGYHPNRKMFLSGSELCAFCLVQHYVSSPCASLCQHCRALHMLTDLVEGQCPKLKGFAQEECNSMMPCGGCQLGKRMADLQAGKEVSFGQDKQEKQEEKQISQGSECRECLGVGLLPLLVFCCTDGCHKCGFLKFKPHPAVKRLHMRPIITERELKQCAICLQVIKQGDSVFRMQCDHEFHFLCMGQWLLTSKRCPYCRHTDMFLEVDARFLEILRQMQGHPKPEVIPAYINEYGEVVEGIQSDEAYSQEEEEDENVDIDDDDEAEVEEQPIGSFPVDVIQNNEEGEVVLGSEVMMLLSGIGVNFAVSNNFLSGHSGYSQSSQEECCFEGGDDDYDGLWG